MTLQRAKIEDDNQYLATFGFLPFIWLKSQKVKEIVNAHLLFWITYCFNKH